MVVIYNMNVTLNTNELVQTLPINDEIIKIEKRGVIVRGESSRDKIKRRPKKTEPKSKTGFGHNSITVVVMNNGDGKFPMKEITVKIFQNGVFHFTGVLDDSYDRRALDILISAIPKTCITNEIDDIKIINRRVVLMNYTSELTKKTIVAREGLSRAIRSIHNPEITVSYDPDVYPGIKIKFSNRWTANIFRTGKIILTGITSKEECDTFKNTLEDLLEKTLP